MKKIILCVSIIILTVFLHFMHTIWSSFNYNAINEFTPFKYDDSTITLQKSISGELPTIDAAVAFYPLASQMVELIYNKGDYCGELSWVSTQEAYQNIIDGEVDIVIASAPSEEQKNMIIESGKELKFVPIAKDALIFYVNTKNKIESLTCDEIEKIYIGEYDNWQDVGSTDSQITTYQLEKNNGSQTAFETIVENNVIDKNHKEVSDMISIIKKVVYNQNSIAYAFNSFYTQQFNSSKLKLISVDGIEPSKENIVSGKYPLMYEVYMIYDVNNTNTNIIEIEEWLTSKAVQEMAEEMGFQK